jgi:hypothetical protein
MRPKRQSKRLKGRSVRSQATTEDENNPTYQESNGSSSRTPTDDGNDGDDTAGGTSSLAAQGGGHERPLSPFAVDEFTHCTQNEDHDVPTSARILVGEANAPVDSSVSSSQWTDDLPIPGPYTYTSHTFTVSNLPIGFKSGLIWSCRTCVTRTGKALLNGPISHGRNIRHIFFEPKVLCSCRRRSIIQCNMCNQCSGLFTCTMYDFYGLELCIMVFIYVYYGLFACINLVDVMSLFS